ncbi:hypothetical protein KUTeg_019334 [Tegillarca granosa]|uniref:FHA domain-containing protein n=1 Tax=Tegillarca granosa TaxID=220873 RepID=A0ABQ9EI65_TEGGR|nr:hypothetical protein KUTeg_019334 [Tegillarca granosa]
MEHQNSKGMQPGMAVNIRGLPLYHLRRHGPTATKEGVSDIMDFFKVTTIIGRKTRLVDYVLDSADPVKSKCISRRHGRVIHKQNNQHYFYDDSMNGIYINNVKIADKVLLQEGDLVTFGHRKGKKFQPGTVIEQPDSEYQFVFEKCNCSHNLLQNEDEEDSRATSDRPISSLHTNTVAEETSCKKKGTEHLYTDTSDEGPSSNIKLCENDKHRSAVIKINERNILRTSKKLDDIQYMQEQNENCEAENDEDIDIICIKNDSSKMKTSKHTVKNKDQLKSIDLTDLQNDMNSNQVTEQPELIDPIIPQQDGSGVNSDQDMEPSEDEMSQKSFRKTIQLLIHQELDKNNTDNVMHDNGVLHIPQSEKTESVNDSLLQIHENLARNNTENICNNDGLNSNLLVSVRNLGITERMENVVNGNVGHEIDEVDGSLSSRSDSPEFLFQENPITSVKVKVEDEFTSKCPRKSKVLPNIENNLIFNVEEDTVKKESFLPITFSDSAEYLSDASSEEFPAAFTVTVGKEEQYVDEVQIH